MIPNPFMMARFGHMISEIEHSQMEEYVQSLERYAEDAAVRLRAYETVKELLMKFVEHADWTFSSEFKRSQLANLSALVKKLP